MVMLYFVNNHVQLTVNQCLVLFLAQFYACIDVKINSYTSLKDGHKIVGDSNQS